MGRLFKRFLKVLKSISKGSGPNLLSIFFVSLTFFHQPNLRTSLKINREPSLSLKMWRVCVEGFPLKISWPVNFRCKSKLDLSAKSIIKSLALLRTFTIFCLFNFLPIIFFSNCRLIVSTSGSSGMSLKKGFCLFLFFFRFFYFKCGYTWNQTVKLKLFQYFNHFFFIIFSPMAFFKIKINCYFFLCLS